MTSVADPTARTASETFARDGTATSRRTSGPLTAMLRWASIVVVGALVLEMTCRVEDWVMYRMPLLSRFESLDDLLIRDADGKHGRANAQFQKWHMNSLGTRGPETTLIPAQGTTRVITIGASETFGLRESADHEYPRQLEDSLRAKVQRGECGADAGKFEVLNAAIFGMTIPTTDLDLQTRLRRMQPKIVFAYPPPVQYLEDELAVPVAPDSTIHVSTPPFRAALRPRVVNRAREQLKLLLPDRIKTLLRGSETQRAVKEHGPGWRFTSVPQDRVAALDSGLRQLVGTIRSIGAEPVLATHANIFDGRAKRDKDNLVAWEKFIPRATGETIIAFDSISRAVTARVAADSNVVLVDAAKRLASAPTSAFADMVHFTDLGAAHMADVASEGVLAAARAKNLCRGGQ